MDTRETLAENQSPYLERFSALNYYEILDIQIDAPFEAITQAYKRALQTLEPTSVAIYSILDKTEASAMAALVEKAYKVLKDPMERRRYDVDIGNPSVRQAATTDQHLVDPESPADTVQRTFSFFSPVYSVENIVQENGPAEKTSDASEATVPGHGVEKVIVKEFPQLFSPEKSASENTVESAHPPPAAEKTDFSGESTVAEQNIPETPESVEIDVHDFEIETEFETEAKASMDAQEAGKAVSHPSGSDLYNDNPQFQETLETGETVFSGAVLRNTREQHGLSLEDISSITRISKANLINIENDMYKDLPALVYVRGYLTLYAKCLRLEPLNVTSTYIRKMQETSQEQ